MCKLDFFTIGSLEKQFYAGVYDTTFQLSVFLDESTNMHYVESVAWLMEIF